MYLFHRIFVIFSDLADDPPTLSSNKPAHRPRNGRKFVATVALSRFIDEQRSLEIGLNSHGPVGSAF